MRTTSSLEAYNCQLNKVVANHARSLFTFVHDLRGEEFLKSEEMEQFIMSGSATAKKRRVEYIVSVLFLFLSLFWAYLCYLIIIISLLLSFS